MPRFLSNQKTPSNRKTFFQNYYDHLQFIRRDFFKDDKLKITRQNVEDVTKHILDAKRISCFDGLRDKYDYCDEIMGATIVPILGAVIFLGGVINAIWEGLQLLATQCGFIPFDTRDHSENAIVSLMAAGSTLVIAAATFIKSLISVFTRPLVTFVSGWQPQNVDRFYRADSLEAQGNQFMASF